MEKLRVYLETSFFSYLTGRRTADRTIAMRQAETVLWWMVITMIQFSRSVVISNEKLFF